MNRDISKQLMLGSQVVDKEKKYWMSKLSGELTKTGFPYDFPFPPGITDVTGAGGHMNDNCPFSIPGDLSNRLIRLSNDSGYNLFMVLLSAVVGLLNKHSGSSDIIVAVPIYKQSTQGEFLNTVLAIRSRLPAVMTFKELLLQVKQSVIEANENVNYPIGEMQQLLELPSGGTVFSLFESVVLSEDIHDREYLKNIKPNILFSFRRSGKGINGTLEYNSLLYKSETASAIIRRFIYFLQQVLENPAIPIVEVSILSEEERTRILEEFNATTVGFPGDKTVRQLFRKQAERNPSHISVIYEDHRSSYGELDKKSGQLARYLQRKGVKAGSIVGIMIEPSIERMIGMMAILKTRSAYLPIDSDYPPERINYMLTDCQVDLLLTCGHLTDETEIAFKGSIVNLEDNAIFNTGFETGDTVSASASAAAGFGPGSLDLIYVIYTSGTSGKPKGVLLSNRNIVNYVTWFAREAQLTVRDKTTLTSSFAFDLGYTSIYSSLLSGCELHLLAKETYYHVEKFLAYILDNEISYIKLTPSLFSLMVNNPGFSGEMFRYLRLIVLGGEAINLTDVEKMHVMCDHVRVMNHYGPTEATIGCIARFLDFNRFEEYKTNPTIGQPISNMRAIIIDINLNLLPIGVPGELAVSGIGLSMGYLNQPELTNKKFLWKMAGTGGGTTRFYNKTPPGRRRLYKTGDRARWSPDGKIEFLGRIDHQVKIRGFRVEPGEIETQLLKHPDIRETALLVKGDENANKYLCAYIVSDSELAVSELRAFLSSHLPDFMIPSYLVTVDKIPLTGNGKVDVKALPSPELQKADQYIAPRNQVEQTLAELWADVLHLKKELISIDANLFELGGHSLSATILITEMHKVFDVNVPMVKIFEQPSIEALAVYIKESSKEVFAAVTPVEEKEYYPLSSAQTRLYILQQMELESTAYNIFQSVCLEGEPDRKKLEEIFRQLVLRHESLRTSFIMTAEKPVQKISGPVNLEFSMEFYDAVGNQNADSIIRGFVRPFDLSQAPLFRVGLAKIEPLHYVMMVDMHHIISDGISHSILIREFINMAGGLELPLLRLCYKDYSQWQQSKAGQKVIQTQEEYWKRVFPGEIPVLSLPADYPRPSIQDFSGRLADFDIGKEETGSLNEIARSEGATIFMVLLAIYTLLLSKLSSQEDIVVGTPVAARRHADLQYIIGMFVNTLALRSFLSGEMTFSDFLGQVKERTLSAFDNQDYLFEDLVENTAVQRDMSRNPLFDVMFVFRNIFDTSEELSGEDLGGVKIKRHELEHRTSKFDLSLFAAESGDKLYFSFEYCTKLFKEGTIRRFIGYFKKIVSAIVENPGQNIAGIEIITTEEKMQILSDFNDTRYNLGFPGEQAIYELFEMQVERTPDHIALVGEGQSYSGGLFVQLTYNELNKRSEQLACLLRERGVKSDGLVAVMIERSVEMILAIFGTIKAGGAYLPIDTQSPGERKKYMLRDSGVDLLITDCKSESLSGYIPGGIGIIDVGEEYIYHDHGDSRNRGHKNKGSDLVYVIYTSGSTGKPKGVMIEHRALVNRLSWMQRKYPLDERDMILQKTPVIFDVSLWELFWWSFCGASLCLLGVGEEKSPGSIVKAVEKNSITTIHFVPSMLSVFLDYISDFIELKRLSGIKRIFSSGEALSIHHLEKFNKTIKRFDRTKLVNLYGPTEATVDVSYYNCDNGHDSTLEEIPKTIPIGKPIDNINLYIINRHVHLLPVGIPGELCIAGIGLARGYLDNPELTAEKFINQKFLRGSRGGNNAFFQKEPPCRRRQNMYKTGDLASWRADGNIEFLGRIDHQVKIRGFRVELGEIESWLLRHSKIKEAVVQAGEDETGDKYLSAYFVSDGSIEGSELKKHLSCDLPEYMVPSYFINIDRIPLTSNGKVDRGALPLPVPGIGGIGRAKKYTAPGNEIEKRLVEIWSGVLGRGGGSAGEMGLIGIDDNFFGLGGHSLKATILAGRIHREFEVRAPLAEIFKRPTIRGLAEYIKESVRETYIGIEVSEEKEYYVLSSAQKRLYILQQMELQGIVYNMPQVIKLEEEVAGEKLEEVFRKVIRRYESLRTSFIIVNGELVQKIDKRVHFSLEYYNLAEIEARVGESPARSAGGEPGIDGVDGSETRADLEKITRDFVRPFDLTRAPLLRAALVKIGEQKHVLLVDMHHIISDGVSKEVLVRVFMDFYRGEKLPELRLQYKDYAQWQKSTNLQELLESQEKYWLKRFSNEVPALNLPMDYSRPAVQSFAGESIPFEIRNEESESLKELAKREGVTIFMLLLALYTILLSRLSQQEDIIVGTPVAGRRHFDLAQQIGIFINTLVLRNYLPGEKRFTSFLKEVKERSIGAFENQDYPFEDLVERVAVNRDASRNPLFDVMFSLMNQTQQHGDTVEAFGAASRRETGNYGYKSRVSMFDMTLTGLETGGQFKFVIEYCTKLFKKETIERFINYYKKLVSSLLENPGQKISDLEIMPEKDRQQILNEFNKTGQEYDREKLVYRLFEEQAARTPDNIALVGPGVERSIRNPGRCAVTYGELNQKSNQLARLLQANGIKPGSMVGIMTGPGIEMIIGLIAVLKAGGAYLPLDPEYPGARKSYMIKDSSVEVLLTQSGIIDKNKEAVSAILARNIFYLDESAIYTGEPSNPDIKNNLQQPVYVIYTSGTTGKPKGVVVEHRNVTAYLHAFNNEFSVTSRDIVIQQASYSFDAFVEEIYPILLKGGKLAIPEKNTVRDMDLLCGFIARNNVTMISCSPLLLKELNQHDSISKLHTVQTFISGGDVLKREYIDNLMTVGTVFNTYGPTETTVCATYYRCSPGLQPDISIGKPIANYHVYILDKTGRLQPVGIPGELCISGDGVGRGYLNQPELTNSRFHTPHIPHSFFYHTGDLARWLFDGNIEFLGRLDQQVKLRGYRIELKEIESQLLEHETVKEALVITGENQKGNKYLCAYVVLKKGAAFSIPGLREFLATRLPSYMLPAHFVNISGIPLTPSGKIDKTNLPEPQRLHPPAGIAYAAPKTNIEKTIAGIWEEVLGLEKVGIHENFFEVGGNSLDIIKIKAKFKEILNKDIDVVKIFEYGTISSFASFLQQIDTGNETGDAIPVPDRTQDLEKGKKSRKQRQQIRKRSQA